MAVYLLAAGSAWAAAIGLKVSAIRVGGRALGPTQSAEVDVIAPGANVAKKTALRVNDELAVGSEIVTPARTQVELESPNGNRLTLEPVTRLKINTTTAKGESYGLNSGAATFDVSRALDFFHVNYEKFLAIVRGTRFSVTVDPGRRIDFSLAHGRLLVEREARVRIRETGGIAALRVPELLAEGRRTQTSYRLDVEEYLREFDTLKEAEDYFREKLRQDEESGDPDRRLDGLNALGVILHLLGKDRAALEVLERGFASAKERADPRVAAIFANNLGAVHQRLGELERAIARQEAAISYRRVLYPDGLHEDIAGSHNNLGAAYLARGQHDEAAKQFELSLSLQRRLYQGDIHPAVAQLLNNLGILERTRGRFEQARAYHQRALDILLKLYPNPHPAVASTYARLSAALAALGNYKEASRQQEKGLALLRKLYPGEVHPEVADGYTNLGTVYAAQGDPARSAAQHRAALDIRRKLYGQAVHPALALSYANLGAALLDSGDFKQALDHLSEAARQHAALYPDGMHIDVAVNRTNLGAALAGLGNARAALVEYEAALNIWRQSFHDEPHPGTAITLDRMGSALLALKDSTGAIARHEQALAIRVKLFPDGLHRAIAASYRELARAWEQAGDAVKAGDYRRKLKALEAKLPP